MFRILFIILFCYGTQVYASTSFDSCSPRARINYTQVSSLVDIDVTNNFLNKLSREERTTLLNRAFKKGKYELVQALLKKGADPNALFYCGLASKDHPHPIVLEQLLSNNFPTINLFDSLLEHGFKVTPNKMVALYGSVSIPYYLSQPNNTERIALMKEVLLLMKSKTHPYKRTGLSNLLNWAMERNSQKSKDILGFIEWLIKEEIADINKQSIGGWGGWPAHPLSYAISKRSEHLIDFLLANGANVVGAPEEATPLYYAVGYADSNTVKKLLERGEGIYTQVQLDDALDNAALNPLLYSIRLLLLEVGAKPVLDNRCDAVFCADGWPGEGEPKLLYKNTTVKVYEWASESAKNETWEVEPKKQVKMIKTRVNSTKTIIRMALENFKFECGEAKKGDIIETLQYDAEGYYYTLHNNQICDSDTSYYPKTVLVGDDGLNSQWWIKIKKKNSNKEGWIKTDEKNFIFLNRSF